MASTKDPFATSAPAAAAAPRRVVADDTPRGDPRPPPRHVLRPIEEYEEFEEDSRLKIPRSMFPADFDLQWVTVSVFGKAEPQRRARFERQGWKAVWNEDEIGQLVGHLFVPASHRGEIEVDGLVLMARPLAWSKKAKATERARAFERVQIKEQQLREGALSGKITGDTMHPTALNSNTVRRTVEEIPVPD